MQVSADTGEPAQGRSVLVVDDDDDIRGAVQEVLEGEGYTTVGASNGKEALDVMRTSTKLPALVLLDLMMPEMDGWELLVRMDEDPTLHRVPVALMSAHPSIRKAFDSDHRNHRMEFRIAIDDLGAGYAGLTSFAAMEPQFVKLDGSLVRGVDRNPTKQRLIRSMTSLCNDLAIITVAECIDTVTERETLVDLGCDLLQGYLLAKPDRPFPSFTW